MNKPTIGIICGLTGAGIGGVLTYIFTKRKYDKKLVEAVRNYTEVFDTLKEEPKAEAETKKEETNDIPIDFEESKTIEEKLTEVYHPESLPDEEEEKHAVTINGDLTDPFYIDPSEFGSEYYDKLYWTVYKDGIVADERDDIVRNPISVVGESIMNDLKTMGNDFIYVRNVALNVDIEIAQSVEAYMDVVSKHPYGL